MPDLNLNAEFRMVPTLAEDEMLGPARQSD